MLGEVARLQAEESMSPLAAIKAVYAELALGPAAARRALIPPGAVRSL